MLSAQRYIHTELHIGQMNKGEKLKLKLLSLNFVCFSGPLPLF
jgi:hypothetical protein